MDEQKVINGNNEEEIWEVIKADLKEEELFVYDVLIRQGDQDVQLYIDIDPGGGFESGSELTMINAKVPVSTDFRFAIHHEDLIDEIGKFFGMQDVETGYDEFDKQVVVKTNDEQKVSSLFSDEEVRRIFAGLDRFDLGIHARTDDDTDVKAQWLEFNIEEGITDATQLRRIYHAFFKVLKGIS